VCVCVCVCKCVSCPSSCQGQGESELHVRCIYLHIYIYIHTYIDVYISLCVYIYTCGYSALLIEPGGSPLCARWFTRLANWRRSNGILEFGACNLECCAHFRGELAHHFEKSVGSGMVFSKVPRGLAVEFDKSDDLQLTLTSMTTLRAQFVCSTGGHARRTKRRVHCRAHR